MATPVWVCVICGKTVSRLFGLGAKIRTPEGEVQDKISVAGYCAAHRDEVLPFFEAEMSKEGEVLEVIDNPQPLRPHEADRWAKFTTDFIGRGTGD